MFHIYEAGNLQVVQQREQNTNRARRCLFIFYFNPGGSSLTLLPFSLRPVKFYGLSQNSPTNRKDFMLQTGRFGWSCQLQVSVRSEQLKRIRDEFCLFECSWFHSGGYRLQVHSSFFTNNQSCDDFKEFYTEKKLFRHLQQHFKRNDNK